MMTKLEYFGIGLVCGSAISTTILFTYFVVMQ